MKDRLEFLANKSEALVEKQVAAYRQRHANSGIIIGVSALFIPFFLGGMKGASPFIYYLSFLSIILFVISIISFLIVLKGTKLHQGFRVEKFEELANASYEEVLAYEIGANRDSFKDNRAVVSRAERAYNIGIILAIVAILLSVMLLSANYFFSETIK